MDEDKTEYADAEPGKWGLVILNALRVPMTARQVSVEYDIPTAAAYRTIRMLVNLGIVVVFDRVLTRAGKRASVYIAVVAYAPSQTAARLIELARSEPNMGAALTKAAARLDKTPLTPEGHAGDR